MSVADKLQVLVENEQRISNEVGDQADLIAQITSVIDEKLAGGGGEEPVNKLASVVDGTVTELTAEDLAGADSIRIYAFYNSSYLKSIVIPDSVTKISSEAFYNCYKLTSLVIGNSVKEIGISAFAQCSGLSNVEIPDSVTHILKSAFYYCTNLTRVKIGNGVKKIGDTAFYNCNSLTSIVIPDSVTEIGKEAFGSCKQITSIAIPDGVTSIPHFTFYKCENLKRVDFSKHIQVPTLGTSVFTNTHSTLQIKVPASLIDSWKSATNWADIADKIVTEFTNEV